MTNNRRGLDWPRRLSDAALAHYEASVDCCCRLRLTVRLIRVTPSQSHLGDEFFDGVATTSFTRSDAVDDS